jgi:hypothetical protein
MNPMKPYLLTLACAAFGMNCAWGQVALDGKQVLVPKPPVWVEEWGYEQDSEGNIYKIDNDGNYERMPDGFQIPGSWAPAEHEIPVHTQNGRPDWRNAVSFEIVKQPAHGTLGVSFEPYSWWGPYVTYTPNEGYLGTDDFTWAYATAAGTSNVATTRILIREDGDRAGMTVILVVKDTLLPELSAEINRLKADLDAEGYRAKIKPWSSTSARELYAYLQSEYFSEAQFVAGAIFIGALPVAYQGNPSSAYMTDLCFMDMTQEPHSTNALWFNSELPDIWVSRMTAFNCKPIMIIAREPIDCRTLSTMDAPLSAGLTFQVVLTVSSKMRGFFILRVNSGISVL